MYPKTEVQGEILMFPNYNLRVYNKDKHKLILDRYIVNKESAVKLYNEQVNIYHNMNIRVIINLYDLDKCTNIEYYDSDDNI